MTIPIISKEHTNHGWTWLWLSQNNWNNRINNVTFYMQRKYIYTHTYFIEWLTDKRTTWIEYWLFISKQNIHKRFLSLISRNSSLSFSATYYKEPRYKNDITIKANHFSSKETNFYYLKSFVLNWTWWKIA